MVGQTQVVSFWLCACPHRNLESYNREIEKGMGTPPDLGRIGAQRPEILQQLTKRCERFGLVGSAYSSLKTVRRGHKSA